MDKFSWFQYRKCQLKSRLLLSGICAKQQKPKHCVSVGRYNGFYAGGLSIDYIKMFAVADTKLYTKLMI